MTLQLSHTHLRVPMTNDVDTEIISYRCGQFVDIDFGILGHPLPPLPMPVEEGVHGAENETGVYPQVRFFVGEQGVDEGDSGERLPQTHAMSQDSTTKSTPVLLVLLHRFNYVVVEKAYG